MAKSSKEVISERRERIEEYKQMRQALKDIIEKSDTSNADRIAAISMIYKLDAEGVPMPKEW